MSSLDKSWSKAAVRCPRHEHAGSRVRFDGHYGVPGHRRQLYKCIPVDGERPHRFSENLPRQESWAEACEACERDELVAPRRVRTFVEADVALASLAGLGPGLLPRKVLREAMRTLSVDRNALVQLSTMPGHAVMPSKRTRDPACSCLGHLTAALLQLLSSDDISPVTVGATSDIERISQSILSVRMLCEMRSMSEVAPTVTGEMSSLDKSWSKAAVRCPRHEHAGSRVRFDGHYGVPGHRRQLYKCIPVDGERPHRFSENLPREESWAEACEACERDVGFHEGPHAARCYQFVARGIAGALGMVGAGGRPVARCCWTICRFGCAIRGPVATGSHSGSSPRWDMRPGARNCGAWRRSRVSRRPTGQRSSPPSMAPRPGS